MFQSSPDFNGGAGGPDFDTDIAVVGMACRFAGARDLQEYWSNLREGVESIVTYSDEELKAAGINERLFKRPNYVPAGAPLPDMEMFDAGLFGLSPRDAAIMDPQHRHFLQCAWAALEDAGHVPEHFAGAIGIFAGSGHNAYLPYNLLTNPDLVRKVGFFLLRHTGNDKDFLTTRASYLLDLKGPSVNVQTACSTSLVAIHMAMQSLLNGESDMALAGGVTIELPHRQGYLFEQGEILSPDGHCRAFDANAAGTVFGSGAGVVVLRRLKDAVADGDHIYAVVKGSAVNNDGIGKVSYLAPSVDGQAEVITEALSISDVDAGSIGYVEAHGTGTPVGDPIEVAALTQAFRQDTDANGYCALGSVKPNIGHTDTAAGVASFIKVAMALHHGELPPSLNHDAPNPACAFDHTPFYVNTALRPWERPHQSPRRAGVSSLGVGGTNCHVILEEAPAPARSGPSRSCQLLTLSAASQTALQANMRALASHLESHPEAQLPDIAYTLQIGRKALGYRRAVVVADPAEAIAALDAAAASDDPAQDCANGERNVAFLFAGGGAQYPNMALGLYLSEAVFRSAVDECLEILSRSCGLDIRQSLFPGPGKETEAQAALQRPSIGLPALFTVQYATARLWMSWGINPAAMIGHSMGEYIAAHLAGVFDLGSALKLASGRGRLFETCPEGRMLSVPLAEEELRPLLQPGLSVAAVNGPRLTVASGPIAAIERLRLALEQRDIIAQEVQISVAAHSQMLDPILGAFRDLVRSVQLKPPSTPFISCLTGQWISPSEAVDPDYWVRHLRETVRFADGLDILLADRTQILLEVGPGRTLASLARQHPARSPDQPVFNSLRHPDEKADDLAYAMNVLGRLWASGVPVPWGQFWLGEQRRRVSLPTYRFDNQRHWIEPGRAQLLAGGGDGEDGALVRRSDLHDWLYEPVWRRSARLEGGKSPDTALVFLDDYGLGEAMVRRLRAEGCRVATVRAGSRFQLQSVDCFQIAPDSADDYQSLLSAMSFTAEHIYHFWLVGGGSRATSPRGTDRLLEKGFYSLLYLAQAIGQEGIDHPVRIAMISDRMQRVLNEQDRVPLKAAALGPVRVIPREYPNITISSIDLDQLHSGMAARSQLTEALIAELSAPEPSEMVTYRNEQRWVQQIERTAIPTASHAQTRLRPGGVYLITGGLGGIGLALARHLSDALGARLVLIGRTPLPPRESWADYLYKASPADPLSRRVRQIRALEARGAEILLLTADVTDAKAMRRAVRAARARFGQIHGIFHTAGALDDAPIQLKKASDAASVLAPKLKGALALDAALGELQPDFIMLFSSISAVAGIAGQVDYAAANAFLDAYATARRGDGSVPVISVGWGQWQEVGMAAALVDSVAAQPESAADRPFTPIDHPFLDRVMILSRDARIYSADFSPETRWLLDEHRLSSGSALIPGAGLVEIARAAFQHMKGPAPVELRELTFLAPFGVADGQMRELRVDLRNDGGDLWRFSIIGRQSNAPRDAEWTEHARGFVSAAERSERPRLDSAAIIARCHTEQHGTDATASAAHLKLGPRWNNIDAIHAGNGEALVELCLADAFVGDLNDIHLHPALLDFATAGAQMLIPNFDAHTDFFAPASYGRIQPFAPLSQRIISHIRYRAEAADPGSFATFDITIATPEGVVLAEIEAFTMMRVRDPAMLSGTSAIEGKRGRPAANRTLAISNAHGILPTEGMAIIEHILNGEAGPHIIVSPLKWAALLAQLRTPARAPQAAAGSSEQEQGKDAPRTGAEQLVAELWAEMLGLSHVRRNDDFFELGGHSLLAVQFINRLRKQSGTALPLTALIEAPTVAQLAALIEPPPLEAGECDDIPRTTTACSIPGLISLRPGEGKPPLFLVHDGLGETLLYRTLALLLDPGHHVYGLQPETSADGSFAHTRIDEMASAYIARLQAVQPHGPYLLAGLCAGGVIAFEMARQLQDRGENVRFVGIIDAADVEAAARPFNATMSRLRRLRDLLAFRSASPSNLWAIPPLLLRKFANTVAYEVHSRLEKMRHHRAVEQMREGSAEHGKTPAAALSFLQLYQVAHRQHRPRGLLTGCHVVLFKATQGTGEADDIPFGEQYSDCIMGWGKRVAEAVHLVEIPGGHTSSLQQPNVPVLARAMQGAMDAALGSHAMPPIPLPVRTVRTPAMTEQDEPELLPQ